MTTQPQPTTERIAERLAGKTLLLTGATGFVGKTVLAACLDGLPELREIRLLLRAPDDEAAARRLREEVLSSRAFSEGAVETDLALETGRLRAVAGDLGAEGLGRSTPPELSGIDVVIHCAASVSFEQPLDEMLELNALGAARLIEAVRASGSEPDFVHVSTAYAAGSRSGIVLERPSGQAPAEPAVDLLPELEAARSWRRELESDSRLPEHQHRFVAAARQEIGPAGEPAVGARAEEERRTWVSAQLTERGRERSRALGWPDAYGFSKALGERLLLEQDLQHVTIVRPSIIESALRRPYPGWLEDLKVAEPIILAYASGMLTRFPGNRSVRVDMIPVDLVANACIVAAALPPEGGPRTVAVVSGMRRPMSLDTYLHHVGDYFRERPLPDEDGVPVEIRDADIVSRERAIGAIDRAEQVLGLARRLIERVPVPRTHDVELRLHRKRRRFARLRRLAEMYAPYVELDCIFDDRQATELLGRMHPDDAERFSFDSAAIDWETYLKDVHLPAVRELVGVPRVPAKRIAAQARAEAGALEDGPAGLAFFDVEGVVLDSTLVHFYAWLRTRGMASGDRLLWSLGLAARAPGWLASDRRSRAVFTRRFYRNYRGLPVADLREQAQEALSEFILPRIQHDAVRRIRAHRARGDRVVLITGALDFLVEPLRFLADELVAARLDESRGAFTGELAEPPLTADARASLAARMVAERGGELGDCHAYADSLSDLPLLELVGHPHAVNPDFRLSREARRRRWPVLEWRTEPGSRTTPLVASGA